MSDDTVADLSERARAGRVVVVGGGIAGLVAALECAKVGLQVTVLEAAPALGGAIRGAEVGGIALDAGAESYATRGGVVRALVDDLGLTDAVVTPAGGRAWVTGLPGAAPLPVGGVLGIPENPWAPDVRRIIGWSGAWRAFVDRLRPPLTIGHQHSLGVLVGTRMGPRVRDRLVAPVVSGVYSARPDDIDVDLAAPGLNAALTRAGSLSGAVGLLKGQRDPSKAPGAAVESLVGGMTVLVHALAHRLADYDVQVRTSVPVEALAREGEEWIVSATPADAEPESITADAVLVATDEATARALLAPFVAELADAPLDPPRVDIITLVLDAPALDDAPRGSGVLTVPGTSTAKALTHATAKWAWLGERAGGIAPHRHVVRVSFGAQGEAPATNVLDDDAAASLALSEAAAMLGVPLSADMLVDAHVERFTQSQPASVIGQADRARAARDAAHAVPGIGVAGAWLAGTGLAQVVPDARAAAEHVRRHVLFGDEAAD